MGIKKARKIAGMSPWACSYTLEGLTYGLTLYATSPEQLERDWAELGETGLYVEGKLIGTVEI